jgi:hypothetical protein
VSILALDPGPTETAFVEYDGAKPISSAIIPNDTSIDGGMLDYLDAMSNRMAVEHLAIEGIACYGMPVGKETFDTCIWIGRFIEAWGRNWSLVYRPDVKLHLCKSARAKDANIRQALIDRYGPSKRDAIGVKSAPGPLYGIKSHCWSALAVAVTYCETKLLSELPGGAS